jgi:hypothetical protein
VSGLDDAAVEDTNEGAGRDNTLVDVKAEAVVAENALFITSACKRSPGWEGTLLCGNCAG